MEELEQSGYKHQLIIDLPYGKAWVIPQKKTLLCELTDSYVPIERFRDIFMKMGEAVKGQEIERFIFDKRHLRVFHQPSMEWYFIEWKKSMYDQGMVTHRKILPKGEDWFEDAVKAGRALIREKHPDNIIDKLDIQYCDSVTEALEK
ncbi:MAG: hypothetical protein AAF740_04020 [Bacteroidota bacterium]